MPPAKTRLEVEAEADEVEETSKTFKNHKARTAMMVTVIGAACAGIASIVVPITQTYFISRPAVKSNSEEVMKALKEASERQDKEIRQMHDDMTELRSWLKGYLAAQGVKVLDPPDQPSPSTQIVEITKPRRLGGAGFGAGTPQGQVLVGTPLPNPKPLTRAKEIPVPFVPPPQQ